jgi:metal-responsive CopG/Arc/MetJ family transcriptional regulator
MQSCSFDSLFVEGPFRFVKQPFRGYTMGMKTAISLPDDLFEGAERLARQTKKSRSRLFRDALREYLARHTPDHVTEAMDKALTEIGASEDSFVSASARRILERSEW